jgi:hypothetical protein
VKNATFPFNEHIDPRFVARSHQRTEVGGVTWLLVVQ